MEKNNVILIYNIIVKTQKGVLFCVNMQRSLGEISRASFGIGKGKARKILGNAGEESTLATAKELGWKLSVAMHQCAIYQESKAKQKEVPKKSTHIPSTTVSQRFYIYLSKTMKPADVKHMVKQNWCMVVDEMPKVKVSSFHQTKYGMIDPTCTRMSKWKAMGLPVESIRRDNAGESKKLEETINGEKWKININLEYTARYSPQQNRVVETGFSVLLNKGRAMLIDENVPYIMM